MRPNQVMQALPDLPFTPVRLWICAEALNTMTFTEADGPTTLTVLVQHTSPEHRDAHISSGMEDGMQEAMDLLKQVPISLI